MILNRPITFFSQIKNQINDIVNGAKNEPHRMQGSAKIIFYNNDPGAFRQRRIIDCQTVCFVDVSSIKS